MPTLRAFIFDLDGVITDTAEYHYRAWKKLADEENMPFTREDNDQLRGVDRRQSLLLLLKGRVLTEAQMQDWMTRKNDYYRGYLGDITPADLLPGVENFLHEARDTGIKLGLASASKNAKDVIQNLGIGALFHVIGDGYSVTKAKPAPDLFLFVADQLSATPSESVVFEDAEAGIEGALAAGMYAVGLGPASRLGKSHLVLPDLKDVHVNDVINALPAVPC
jgi:beta-phosphoglucomutase